MPVTRLALGSGRGEGGREGVSEFRSSGETLPKFEDTEALIGRLLLRHWIAVKVPD